jgi:hypothetical protein
MPSSLCNKRFDMHGSDDQTVVTKLVAAFHPFHHKMEGEENDRDIS